jgi:2-succinyl-5-enolpyruvyl-6-hydroxy-3-cyclohexene-1-carboxylate synthase
MKFGSRYLFCSDRKIEVNRSFLFQIIEICNLEPKPYYNLWDVLRDKKDANMSISE